GDKQGIAIALGLIGELLSLKGEFPRAIEYLQKNLMLCEELGYQKGIAKAVNTLGDVFYFTHQHERSLHFYERAIQVTRSIGNKSVLCQSLIEKGRVLIDLQRIAQARQVIEEGHQLAQELRHEEFLILSETLQVELLHLDGQNTKALLLLDDLRQRYTSTEAQALTNFLRYQLLPTDTRARDRAIQAYEELYAAEPRYLFRRRLADLRGEALF
ncbi:MAG: tetratricopeptide repeat protein, partial [Bacteroidetes bacterium]